MKRLICIFLVPMLLHAASALGEIRTITHSVKQVFGGSQSPDDAKAAAVIKARREALEMAGTYIESTTIVRDAAVAKDEIIALSAGILKTEVVSQENFHTQDAFGMVVTVKVDIDTSVLDKKIREMLDDRKYVKQLTATLDREKGLLKRIDDLERENLKLKESAGVSPTLQRKFKAASRNLQAVANFERALIDMNNALRSYNRTDELYRVGVVTRAQWEESKTHYEMSAASFRQAEKEMKKANR